MVVHITNAWLWFCIALGIALVASLAMSVLANNFLTRDGSVRRFSIMELEFPSTPLEIVNIIRGIYDLPPEQCIKGVRSLKIHFLLDFILFMPATYGGIFILCMKVSVRMGPYGRACFLVLAWLQLVAFVFDVVENIYLINKIKQDVCRSEVQVHKWYIRMEMAKWGIALLGAIGSFSVLLYYWVSGSYDDNSIPYVFAFLAEVFLFIVVGLLVRPKHEVV